MGAILFWCGVIWVISWLGKRGLKIYRDWFVGLVAFYVIVNPLRAAHCPYDLPEQFRAGESVFVWDVVADDFSDSEGVLVSEDAARSLLNIPSVGISELSNRDLLASGRKALWILLGVATAGTAVRTFTAIR